MARGLWLGGLLMVMAGVGRAADGDDPYLWLEDVTGEKALGWVKEQNAVSQKTLAEREGFKTLDEALLRILDSRERIPLVSKEGEHYYNFWRDATHKKGLWRRTSLEEYRKAEPAWETVLDLDALAAAEKENWVWKGASFLKPNHDRALLQLSRGGADAMVVREFDVRKKEFVKDGFTVPEAKSRVAWRGQDSLFVGTNFGPGSLTESGYPRLVKEWKRGTPLADAKLVYEGKPTDMQVYGVHTFSPGYERDLIERAVTFWTSELYLLKDGRLVKVEKPDDAKVEVFREHLFLELRSPWTVGGQTYPAGSLLATDLDGFVKGERKMEVLFRPTERTSLRSFGPTRHHVLVNELDNVRSRLYVWTKKDGGWVREALPGVSPYSTANASAVDEDESDEYWLSESDYLTPSTLALGTVGKGPAEKLKQLPAFFNANGLVVTQHEAVSKDGTKVPYFQVGPRHVAENGQNPTLLYGYGGFEIPMVPGYNPVVGKAWLEKGGMYVVANIRGGGEFGPRWHQAALKQNRHRAYEDFAAVAEDLVKRKVTSPARLGTMGGSNGGLLMGNMLTLYPGHFGAIVCQVPLLDMKRYHKLLAGASWVAEYGNPDKPEEWAFIQTFSPYQNVKAGAKYPPMLVTTSTRDDRVHPGHARKMVARMKEQGHDVVYFENIEGGHGGAADNKQAAYMWALAYTFLWRQLHGEVR